MALKGHCHCGAVEYEVDVPLAELENGGVICHCRVSSLNEATLSTLTPVE